MCLRRELALAAIVMVAWGRHSDQSGERMFHTLVPLLMLIVSLVGAIFIDSLWEVMTMLCIAVTGTYAFKGPFWALASSWLSASSAAAGIAQINAIGNLGGFIGTYSLGLIKGATDSFTLGMLPIAVMSTIGCTALYAVGRERKRQEAGASAEV
jgi:MFS transporter, ACS family, tartrate transporter